MVRGIRPHLAEVKVRASAVLRAANCVLRECCKIFAIGIVDATIYLFVCFNLFDPISNFPEPGIYLRPLSFDGDEPKAIMNIFVYQSCVNPTCLEFLTILMIAGVEVSVHL